MENNEEMETILHAVVLDYGCGDDEDYKLCFLCDTKEEAIQSAIDMGGDHRYRKLEGYKELKR